jgi:hypothetical protein
MYDQSERLETLALAKITQEIETGKIFVFRNLLNHPYIRVMVEQMPSGCFHLYDHEAEDWIEFFLSFRHQILLRSAELKPVIKALVGRSMMTVRHEIEEPEILHILQTEPVVATTYEYFFARPPGMVDKTMQGHWKDLREFAIERNLEKFGNKRFPGGPNVLSRQLRRFQLVLATLGIHMRLPAVSRGLPIQIGRLDDYNSEPSPQSSGPNVLSGNNLEPNDGKLDQLARLRARQTNQSQQIERSDS